MFTKCASISPPPREPCHLHQQTLTLGASVIAVTSIRSLHTYVPLAVFSFDTSELEYYIVADGGGKEEAAEDKAKKKNKREECFLGTRHRASIEGASEKK
ncbi:hypothetical protein L596_004758 [Steinernema carpocapsae]|uniref:Uncharacterized protein n=1 Tax=Steinernema carpocapsae TaxID=34508 RepID=A0A4V6I880_STECR|nr:hypothetical protein L596_004758 [Steinernema carpocapsae]